jgi:hypothetical protein
MHPTLVFTLSNARWFHSSTIGHKNLTKLLLVGCNYLKNMRRNLTFWVKAFCRDVSSNQMDNLFSQNKVGLKKTCGSRPTLFFLPTLLFFQSDWLCDPIFSRWLRAADTACQNGECCHTCRTNYWTKLPKFVHRKYASLVNIDVGTLLQIAQQKNAKTMKKIFKKKFISDLPTLIFSWYETGTTGFFLRRINKKCKSHYVQYILII